MQSIQSRNHSLSSTDSVSSGKLMSISSIISAAAAANHHKENHMERRSSAPIYYENSPLTLQERRLRNKAASAKYRQKKNQQQNEMQSMITHLSEQNLILERQLEELRAENDRLKTTADKLRGNIVAKKMLKKWIGTKNNASYWSDDEHDELDSLSS